jgi:hypothetical protein
MKYLVRVGVGSVLLLLFASCDGGGGGAPKDGSNDGADSSSSDGTGDRPESGGTDLNTSADVNDADGNMADRNMKEIDASDDTTETGPDVQADGASDSPTDGTPCTLPVTIGCFSGAVCASPQVQAVCMNGVWRCPAGTNSTEFCAPDSGVDVSGGS